MCVSISLPSCDMDVCVFMRTHAPSTGRACRGPLPPSELPCRPHTHTTLSLRSSPLFHTHTPFFPYISHTYTHTYKYTHIYTLLTFPLSLFLSFLLHHTREFLSSTHSLSYLLLLSPTHVNLSLSRGPLDAFLLCVFVGAHIQQKSKSANPNWNPSCGALV